jgi:NTE family protein
VSEADEAAIPAAPPGSPFHSLLGALSVESRVRLVSGSRVVEVAEGIAAVSAGHHVGDLAVVLDGAFRVEAPDRHGLPVEVARFTVGDYFGEMSFLRGERASATVRAATDARLLLIPHAVLAEVDMADAGLRRELVRLTATRLSATTERFRTMRPGRAVSCIIDGSSWSRLAVLQVARSASRHAGAPVLIVEEGGRPLVGACEPLPGVASLAADPALLQVFEAFADQPPPAVGLAPLGAIAEPGLLATVSRLQSLFPLVFVCHRGPLFDGPFAFARADAKPVREQGVAVREILVEQGDGPPRPLRLAGLGEARGTRVIASLTGGEERLAAEPEFPGTREPWRSVDRAARHLLRRTVGLALGAGGAKGFAHVGVIQALRTLGVPVDYLAGSSIGAPLAAGLAVGMGPRALKREFAMTLRRAQRPTFPYQSFLSSGRILRELSRLVAGRTWGDIETPLAIVAVDLDLREEVVLTSGPSERVLAASMAIPGIFAPVELGGRRLVDGGLLNPVPTSVAAALGADVVIGVKLTDPAGRGRPRRRRPLLGPPPIVEHIVSAIDIMQWKITAEGAAEADITISPVFSTPVGLRDIHRAAELVAAGEAATLALAPEFHRLLPWVPGELPGGGVECRGGAA